MREALPWLERLCCSARADMVALFSVRSACRPRRRAARLLAFRLFRLTGQLVRGAAVLLGRPRRRFVARARENPAFGSEMLLGCSCSLAAQMPIRPRFELFWVGMKLLRACGRKRRFFFWPRPRLESWLVHIRCEPKGNYRRILFTAVYQLLGARIFSIVIGTTFSTLRT